MEVNVDELLKTREKLLEKYSVYNHPTMFDTKNYTPHKTRIRRRLHKIADILYTELNIDKRKYAL